SGCLPPSTNSATKFLNDSNMKMSCGAALRRDLNPTFISRRKAGRSRLRSGLQGAALLDGPAVVIALFEQSQIGEHVRIGRVLGAGLVELLFGPGIVAAQHVGEALVVEDFRRRADQADGRRIGAVGEVEAAQPVVGRREPDPGAGVVRMLLHGGAEAPLGETEIVAAEIFLA